MHPENLERILSLWKTSGLLDPSKLRITEQHFRAAKTEMMRWRTHHRLAERFEAYDDMTYPDDSALCALAAKLMRRGR